MDDVRRELAGLRRRLRLQAFVFIGAVAIMASALGGAEAVANAIRSEADAWTVKTYNTAGSTLLPRLVATTGADTARLKVQNANIELYPQATGSLPSGSAAGAIAWDSTVSKLKVYNGTSWVEPGPPPPREIEFLIATAAFTWTNMPSAVTEFNSSANFRKKFDLTGFSQFRLTSTQTVVGASSSTKLRMQYSTNGGTSWSNLENTTTAADLDAQTVADAKVGTFANIDGAAKADVLLRIVGVTGNGTADPAWKMIALQVK